MKGFVSTIASALLALTVVLVLGSGTALAEPEEELMTITGQVKRESHRIKRESHRNTGRELGFFLDFGMRGSTPSNDRVHPPELSASNVDFGTNSRPPIPVGCNDLAPLRFTIFDA